MENTENVSYLVEKQSSNENKLKAAAAVLSLLLISSLVWAAFTYSANSDLTGENTVLKSEKEQLLTERTKLEGEIQSMADSLSLVQNLFTNANNRADSLQIRVRKIQESVDKYKQMANSYRNEAASVKDLKNQIASLNRAKYELNTYKQQIEQLQAENSQLKGIVVQLKDENQGLRRQLNMVENEETEIKEKLSIAESKAEIYRVDVKTKSEKLKVKARRAKTITVLFDLPQALVGGTDEKVYLSITDLKLVPIKSDSNKEVRVEGKGGFDPITYQAEMPVDFTKNPQRVAMQYKVDEKLKPGVYVASLYSKKAYLGKIEFSLR